MRGRLLIILLGLLMAVVAVACTDDSAAQRESKIQQDSYQFLTYNQPAQTMKWSSTRAGINFWIETWGCEACMGKLAFVYLLGSEGQKIGYYVAEGLPVSYCALLTPDYTVVEIRGVKWMVKAPSLDGVYYSGGQCSQMYMKDAVRGKYMEFSAGGSLNYLLFEEPASFEVEPLGIATIADVWDAESGQVRPDYQPEAVVFRPPSTVPGK